ncbi:hypothetical protein [Winogradskyella schleiferi]|uniref:hypothetical protein n=1 Tax=Winogradskyella schleiferi TaxID=2686078 RepID=UPI0015BBC72B|nr:hypothetical protein [Winogradskyella schleiferi]
MKLELQIQKNLFKITLIIIVLLQLLVAFQGFDVCDDGFVLTFYQQIFSNPESVEYNFLYWFSGFIGGLWYLLYEDGGILWFRLLGIIVNTLAFYLSYKLLKSYIKQEFLLLALVMVLFVNDYGFLTYYHNYLTALMSVIIIYVLNKAVIKNSMLLYILSGIILSINVFTRIPNLVLFSLVLVVPYAYYLRKESILKSIKPFLFVGFGSVIGFLMVYVTLSLLGQLEIMKNALFTINDLGNTEDSSHNFKSVFMAPYYNYRSIAVETIKLAAIVTGLYVLRRFIPNNKIINVFIFVFSIVLFVFWFNTGNIYPIYSLCLLGALTILFIKKFSNEVKIISVLSFFTLITISLGTGGGIKNSGYMGIWIGLPLFFYAIDNLNLLIPNSKYFNINSSLKLSKKSVHLFLYAIIVAFLLLKTHNISQQAYFDNGSRFEKTYAINSPLAKGIYTTERRAKIVNDLLQNLNKFVKPNDYLMVYDKIPMVHFLTETKPYMYNPWVWIYDYNSFEKKLHKAESEIPVLPIVVQQKFETIYSFSEPIPDYMSTQKENTDFHSNERNAIMIAFLNRNNYEIVWSNPYFNIYRSKNKSR